MRPLPMAITALVGTLTAGLLFTQTPTLTAVGNDDHGKREEDTPSVHVVDDEDDDDSGRDAGKDVGADTGRGTAGRDTGTPSRATRATSGVDVSRNSRNSRNSRVSRDDRSADRSADHSSD